MRFLLDTNTCIAAMIRMSSSEWRPSPDDCVVSTITIYELHTGVEKCGNRAKELAKVDLLLATVSQIAFDALAARQAAGIRASLESQGCIIGPYDVLLAGHALANGLTLVTANTAEFCRVPGISLENWQLPVVPLT